MDQDDNESFVSFASTESMVMTITKPENMKKSCLSAAKANGAVKSTKSVHFNDGLNEVTFTILPLTFCLL